LADSPLASRSSTDAAVEVVLDAVIVAVTDEVPRILTVEGSGDGGSAADADALPFGPLDPEHDRTLERALRAWVHQQTGLGLGYVEQLYTFGDQYRDPVERRGGPRVISIAYLALVGERAPASGRGASWGDWYGYFPWEDWRAGRPLVIDRIIKPELERWAASAPRGPAQADPWERAQICFGLQGAPWDPERVLERYELLYEAGLVAESHRDGRAPSSADSGGAESLGAPMERDHRRILATALGRLRGKLRYRPVVFELLPETFTLLQLQRVVEALSGIRLHKQNFRRLVERGGLVERTGRGISGTGGRPAELFRFRREVLRERPAPGVGLPGRLK